MDSNVSENTRLRRSSRLLTSKGEYDDDIGIKGWVSLSLQLAVVKLYLYFKTAKKNYYIRFLRSPNDDRVVFISPFTLKNIPSKLHLDLL